MTFLSTLSLRRATPPFLVLCTAKKFLSTLSLRRATFVVVAFGHVHGIISIHALLAESDLTCPVHILPCNVFLSTLSLRRATIENFSALNNILISIHALLAESDVVHALKFANFVLFLSTLSLRRATGNIINSNCNFTHFYPRSPCGERRQGDLFQCPNT